MEAGGIEPLTLPNKPSLNGRNQYRYSYMSNNMSNALYYFLPLRGTIIDRKNNHSTAANMGYSGAKQKAGQTPVPFIPKCRHNNRQILQG
jgi:hypothetical protein